MNLYNHPVNKFVAGFIGTPPMNFVNGKIVKDNNKLIFKHVNKKIIFEINSSNEIDKLEGKKVCLGFRAENVGIQNFHKSTSFTGKIETIEILGAEQYITVSGFNKPVVSKISADKTYQLNDLISLNINLENIYFFDDETEICITKNIFK